MGEASDVESVWRWVTIRLSYRVRASVGGCWWGTDGVRVVVVQNKPERPTSLDSISFVYIVAEKIDDETHYCTVRHAKTS